jgi:malonyl CoA-acyl carrier protein transacylase
MLAYVFPGQGSQKRGMGQGLFDSVREYREIESQVDALMGFSIRKMCLEDAGDSLRDTRFTQPCLYVVNALHYYKAVADEGEPDFVAGHSLGEYNALLAAGAFDFISGLRLVKKRGELMSRARNGGMAAVIGLDGPKVSKVIRESALASIDVANFNSPSQTVVSGPTEDVKRAGPVFEKAGARMYVPLQVGAAFHSRYVADAGRVFSDFVAPLSFCAPRMDVIANVTGRPYPVHDAGAVKAMLVEQITRPVLWTQSIRFLMTTGVTEFKEIGPGNVLTRLVQQIRMEH